MIPQGGTPKNGIPKRKNAIKQLRFSDVQSKTKPLSNQWFSNVFIRINPPIQKKSKRKSNVSTKIYITKTKCKLKKRGTNQNKMNPKMKKNKTILEDINKCISTLS